MTTGLFVAVMESTGLFVAFPSYRSDRAFCCNWGSEVPYRGFCCNRMDPDRAFCCIGPGFLLQYRLREKALYRLKDGFIRPRSAKNSLFMAISRHRAFCCNARRSCCIRRAATGLFVAIDRAFCCSYLCSDRAFCCNSLKNGRFSSQKKPDFGRF